MAMNRRDQLDKIRKQPEKASFTVLGGGKSGVAAARLAKRVGAKVFLSEKKLLQSNMVNILQQEKIEFESGVHTERALQCDAIILSPGIPLNIPFLEEARNRKIPIISEIEFAFWFEQGEVVAVTGSQGKTTTTSLIGRVLDEAGRSVFIGGNIGFPYSDFVSASRKDTVSVLEISSFQLETIEFFRPDIAVLTNITPNHLDRYSSMEEYIAAKWNMFKNADRKTTILINGNDPVSLDLRSNFPAEATILEFGFDDGTGKPSCTVRNDQIVIRRDGEWMPVIPVSEVRLRGRHNLWNVMAAALVGEHFGVEIETMKRVFAGFRGIPHRLEEVLQWNGVTFFNDSKSTTVSSLGYALESFDQPIILIAGGKDKGGSFREIRDLVAKKVKKAILIGQSRERIKKEWEGAVQMETAESLKEAVEKSFATAQMGDVVLLSPACSSFDMFSNFEERGDLFRQYVHEIARQGQE